jgi:hypothetical protein
MVGDRSKSQHGTISKNTATKDKSTNQPTQSNNFYLEANIADAAPNKSP